MNECLSSTLVEMQRHGLIRTWKVSKTLKRRKDRVESTCAILGMGLSCVASHQVMQKKFKQPYFSGWNDSSRQRLCWEIGWGASVHEFRGLWSLIGAQTLVCKISPHRNRNRNRNLNWHAKNVDRHTDRQTMRLFRLRSRQFEQKVPGSLLPGLPGALTGSTGYDWMIRA